MPDRHRVHSAAVATRSETWEPPRGWESFRRGDDVEELAWEVLAGWHYMNPTSTTSIWESPSGATVYLAFDDARALFELVIGHGGEEDFELTDFVTRLGALGLRPKPSA